MGHYLASVLQRVLADRLWSMKAPMEPEQATFEVMYRVGDAVHAMVVHPGVDTLTRRRQLSYETLLIWCAPGSK